LINCFVSTGNKVQPKSNKIDLAIGPVSLNQIEKLDLPPSFIDDERRCTKQIQRTDVRPALRNSDTSIMMRLENVQRNALRFFPKNKKIAILIANVRILARCIRFNEKKAVVCVCVEQLVQ